MSPTLQVALIGSGSMGALHARVVSQHPRTALALVVDTDATKGLHTADAWGTRWAPDLESFHGIDAVVVATPSQHHRAWAVRALEAGVPTLVEKPLSQDIDEVREMVDLAERVATPVQCGLLERFNPAVRKMREIISEPMHVSVMRHSPHTPRITTGVAYDLSIHDVDLALRVASSPPSSLVAQFSACHPESPEGSEDVAEILLKFPDGLVAALSASRISQRKLRMLQVAEFDRMVEVDLLRRDITIYHHVGSDFLEGRNTGYRQQTVIDIPAITDAREPLVAQWDHFVELAEGGGDAAAERASILPPHAMLDAALRSVPVSLDGVGS